MTTPYIYTLTFIATGQIYIGSRTRKGCCPAEFWNSYFTSSKDIKRLIDEHGVGCDIWSYSIINVFDDDTCPKQVVKLEHELIKQTVDTLGAQAVLNNSYNQYGKTVFTVAGRNRTPEEREAISKAQTGRKRTPEQIQKHREKMLGRTLTDEHKRKVSDSLMGHAVHQNTLDALSKRQQKWNNCSATSASTARWLNAQAIYDKWLETGFGYARLGKLLGEARQTALQDIVEMFKSGWVPSKDIDWVKFKLSHDVASRP